MNLDAERVAKLEAQVDTIKEDVAELKGDVKEIHSRITTQTREIVEKIDDFQTRIEHKMQANSVTSAQQHDAIKEAVQQDIKKVAETLDKDIKEVTKRVDMLEKWKWMIVGGAVVLGYLIGHLEFFKKFL